MKYVNRLSQLKLAFVIGGEEDGIHVLFPITSNGSEQAIVLQPTNALDSKSVSIEFSPKKGNTVSEIMLCGKHADSFTERKPQPARRFKILDGPGTLKLVVAQPWRRKKHQTEVQEPSPVSKHNGVADAFITCGKQCSE